MTLEECYKNFGGDYQEVENRLCSRKFVEKFLVKFLKDLQKHTTKNIQLGKLKCTQKKLKYCQHQKFYLLY